MKFNKFSVLLAVFPLLVAVAPTHAALISGYLASGPDLQFTPSTVTYTYTGAAQGTTGGTGQLLITRQGAYTVDQLDPYVKYTDPNNVAWQTIISGPPPWSQTVAAKMTITVNVDDQGGLLSGSNFIVEGIINGFTDTAGFVFNYSVFQTLVSGSIDQIGFVAAGEPYSGDAINFLGTASGGSLYTDGLFDVVYLIAGSTGFAQDWTTDFSSTISPVDVSTPRLEVPAPAAWLLLASGLVVLRRRRVAGAPVV